MVIILQSDHLILDYSAELYCDCDFSFGINVQRPFQKIVTEMDTKMGRVIKAKISQFMFYCKRTPQKNS